MSPKGDQWAVELWGLSVSLTLAGSWPVCLGYALPYSAAGLGTLGIWGGPALAHPDHLPPPHPNLELLELWAQGQRDVQRLQRSALLRLLLPAQGLGEAPPCVWPEPARPHGRGDRPSAWTA